MGEGYNYYRGIYKTETKITLKYNAIDDNLYTNKLGIVPILN